MCTKSKTCFGCGHCFRSIESCGIPNCQNLETWKFSRAIDCGKCKAAGEASTRGKDGRGRHGIEQARHRGSRQSSADAPKLITNTPGTANLAISPWARKSPEIPQEKLWKTPTRQKADEAWLVEHERRMSELEELEVKTSKMSLGPSERGSRRSSPRGSHERVIEVTEIFEEPEEYTILPSHSKTVKLLPYEIEEASRSSRSRSRKISHDSEGSMPYYQENPRRKTHFVPPISEYNPPERHEPRRSRQSGSKTEPYYPQSCCFESPMPRSHPTQENWMSQYEVPQPVYRDPYYPRAHQVY